MIWNAVNYFLGLLAAGRLAIMGRLPSSPFWVDPSVTTGIHAVAGYTAFFLPIHAMVVELSLVMVAVSLLMVLAVLWKVWSALGVLV